MPYVSLSAPFVIPILPISIPLRIYLIPPVPIFINGILFVSFTVIQLLALSIVKVPSFDTSVLPLIVQPAIFPFSAIISIPFKVPAVIKSATIAPSIVAPSV